MKRTLPPLTFTLLLISAMVVLPALLTAQTKSQSPSATQTSTGEEAATVSTPKGELHGTLVTPATKPRYPVVLILVGSGPDDRDGNAAAVGLKTDAYKLLAEALKAQGIASLRYDKRGVGQSAAALAKPSDARFDDYVADAVLWANKLRGDKRFSTLTIVGHSEGSLIGMIAAQRVGADAFVSLAGLGRKSSQALLDQLKPSMPADLYQKTEQVVTQLAAGQMVEPVPPQLISYFHPTLQPYLISYFHWDPAQEIRKLTIPILIVQGTTDADVKVEDAKLLALAKPDAKLVLVEGMSHALKHAALNRAEQLKAYTDPSLPLEPQLVTETVNFVKQAKKRRT